jgi:hypothetical protein
VWKYFCAPKNAPKLPEFEEYFFLKLPYFRQIASRSLPKYSWILKLLYTLFYEL